MRCYLAVVGKDANSNSDPIVMIAQKQWYCTRRGGQPVNPPEILNGSGQYVFPGGKQDPNETAEEGAKREFKEETSIDLDLQNYSNKITGTHTEVDPQNNWTLYILEMSFNDCKSLTYVVNGKLRQGTPTDEELYEVKFRKVQQCKSYLGARQWTPQGINPNHKTQKIDWYADMGNVLKTRYP